MKIKKYLNTTSEEVKAKNSNIFIGISLGNKYFSKENIRDYLLWALENTKEKVAVLIPDKIHSVNYEVRSGYTKERALKTAVKKGEKIKEIIKNILNDLNPQKRDSVEILKWEDIETVEHKNSALILNKEFDKNEQFKNSVIEIVRENIQSEKLTDFDYEKLASYPLEELPMLISGIEYKGVKYDLLPYPGISKIDYLAIELQEGGTFPEITEKLQIGTKLKLIEAYIE